MKFQIKHECRGRIRVQAVQQRMTLEQATAAALRVKESVMETVTSVQENAADILASAKEINEQRAKAEEAASVECSEA